MDVKQITSINYDRKLTELQRILNTKSKHQITLLEKITVIKTLALSRLIYLFVNLPDPPDDFLNELNVLLFQILWDGMQSKISRKIVCISRKIVCISRKIVCISKKTALAGRLSALAGRLSALAGRLH